MATGFGRRIDDRDAAGHRRIQLQNIHVIELIRRGEDAVATAHCRAVVYAISETEARRNVPVFVFPEIHHLTFTFR